MATRQSRSASIPIPRSSSSLSPSRNIDSVISIPFATRGRPRLSSAQVFPHRVDDHRGLGASYNVRDSNSALATSPTRPTARSMTPAAAPGRGTFRTASSYEPRVIRMGGEAPRNDTGCLPSTSPSRMRRPSNTGRRATSAQRSNPSYAVSTPLLPPISFPRPAYLEHSALRHMLQTEGPPILPSSRKTERSAHETHILVAPLSPPTDSDDESNASPPRELPSVPPPLPPSVLQSQILKLPTRWSDQFRHTLLSVSADGRDLTYHGASFSGEKDAAAARTVQPIPPACGIYYYEVEVLSKGQKSHISIGFAARDVKLSRLPGWEPNSWGYYGDDGYSFAVGKTGTAYGPTFGTGDVIGCGIDFTIHKAFFTKNGTLIGPIFENIGKDTEIYPSIGLRHSSEAIRVNFGHETFKYDIDYHVQQQRNNVWSKILKTPLDSSLLENRSPEQSGTTVSHNSPLSDEQTKDIIGRLVVSYLEHHGYAKTMRAFQKQRENGTVLQQSLDTSLTTDGPDIDMCDDTLREPKGLDDAIEADIERRTKIVKSVIAGDIDTAIVDTQRYHPAVLEAEEGLVLFKLRCRKFIELILEAGELKKKMQIRNWSWRDDEGMIEQMDGIYEDGMDIDNDTADPSSTRSATTNGLSSTSLHLPGHSDPRRSSVSSTDGGSNLGSTLPGGTAAQYETTLNQAIAYGQALSKDYKGDMRPEVKQIFKRTFAIVAWEDPMAAGGVAAEVVGHEARVALAHELNKAILKSQGHPTNPVLETLYRHTAACVTQLGLLGVGGAAFADMPKEFLDG